MADTVFMKQALALAISQMGRTWPNPAVGCVIVKDGVFIAEGATGNGGRPHAEEMALGLAGETARGTTVYVTLEPCGQRSQGGCSCSQRLINAGVKRVVYACNDPSPFASNLGTDAMRTAGIEVEAGLMAEAAQGLIAPSIHYYKTGLPLVEISEDGQGFDAKFTPSSDHIHADLRDWAERGYRHIYVEPASPLLTELRALGLLTL